MRARKGALRRMPLGHRCAPDRVAGGSTPCSQLRMSCPFPNTQFRVIGNVSVRRAPGPPRGHSIAGRPSSAVASHSWGPGASRKEAFHWSVAGGVGAVVLTMLESEVSVRSLESACDGVDVVFSHSNFALS